ncbi:MAG: DUF4229 domain-containing protein [Actinomycetota bacterium]|nr:DUF4229 domain-containing protein [Actinomycetota bacterium]
MTPEPTEPPPAVGALAVVGYSVARVLVFLLVGVVLSLVGLHGLLLVAVALVVSGVLSYVVLRPQRDAMSRFVADRVQRRRDGRAARDEEDGYDDGPPPS